jgi:hypothetical protein
MEPVFAMGSAGASVGSGETVGASVGSEVAGTTVVGAAGLHEARISESNSKPISSQLKFLFFILFSFRLISYKVESFFQAPHQ